MISKATSTTSSLLFLTLLLHFFDTSSADASYNEAAPAAGSSPAIAGVSVAAAAAAEKSAAAGTAKASAAAAAATVNDAVVLKRPLSQYNSTQKERIMTWFYKWRAEAKPRPDPKEMKVLTWNEELASLAQAQADRCTYAPGYPDWNDTLSILSEYPDRSLGQTHWTGWNSSWATHYWNKEGDWFDYCNNQCTYDRKYLKSLGFYRSSLVYYFRGCVNYTQLVWGDSQYVGCGHRVCGFENYHFRPGSDFHVCYFFPGAILEFQEEERMNMLPYKPAEAMNMTCGNGGESTRKLTTTTTNRMTAAFIMMMMMITTSVLRMSLVAE